MCSPGASKVGRAPRPKRPSSARSGAALSVVALALLLGGTPAAAQSLQSQAGGDRERAMRRLEELAPRLEQARIAMEEAQRAHREEEARRARPPMDTIQVGPIRVVTPPDQTELAAELFGEVWREEFPTVTESAHLSSSYFAFQWKVRPERIYMTPQEAGGPAVFRVELSRLVERTRERAKARIRGVLAEALSLDLGLSTPMRGWLGRPTPGAQNPAAAYYQLALASSLEGPFSACLEGDGQACWDFLVVGFGDGDALLEVARSSYDPRERRQLVVLADERVPPPERGVYNPFRDEEADIRLCVDDVDLDACDRVLAGNFHWSLLLGAGGDEALHWTLLWHSVRQGGEGAWERATARAGAPPAEVLAAASGLAPAELGARWHELVVEHRPTRYADMGGTRWAVLFWVLFFAALAMRSTRWRMG